MSKIDIIDYCGDCSNMYFKEVSSKNGCDTFCELTDMDVFPNQPIPKECPLADKDSVVNLIKFINENILLKHCLSQDEFVTLSSLIWNLPSPSFTKK